MQTIANELQSIIDTLFSPTAFYSLIAFLAIGFTFGWFNPKKGSGAGRGETRLSKQEQMANFGGTQQEQGNTIVDIAETEKGFEAVIKEKDGSETAYSVERDE